MREPLKPPGDFGIDASKLEGTCETRPKDNQIICKRPAAIPKSALFGTMTVLEAAGLANGLLLSGSLDAGATKPALLKVEDLTPFTWDWDDPCGRTDLVARSSFILANDGKAAFVVCALAERGAAAAQFTPSRVISTLPYASVVEYAIPLEDITTEYRADPKPLVVEVHTNGGARVLTLPPIPILTDAELAAFHAVQKVRPGFCYDLEDDPFMRGFDWKTTWKPSPGGPPGDPAAEDFERFWQILIGGLNPNDEVEVVDGIGDQIGVALANEKRVAYLGFACRSGQLPTRWRCGD